jgi:hypothetical protein
MHVAEAQAGIILEAKNFEVKTLLHVIVVTRRTQQTLLS